MEDLSFDLEINLLSKKVSLTNRMNLSIEGELIIFELLCFPTKSWMDGLRERGDFIDSMVIFFFDGDSMVIGLGLDFR